MFESCQVTLKVFSHRDGDCVKTSELSFHRSGATEKSPKMI